MDLIKSNKKNYLSSAVSGLFTLSVENEAATFSKTDTYINRDPTFQLQEATYEISFQLTSASSVLVRLLERSLGKFGRSGDLSTKNIESHSIEV